MIDKHLDYINFKLQPRCKSPRALIKDINWKKKKKELSGPIYFYKRS